VRQTRSPPLCRARRRSSRCARFRAREEMRFCSHTASSTGALRARPTRRTPASPSLLDSPTRNSRCADRRCLAAFAVCLQASSCVFARLSTPLHAWRHACCTCAPCTCHACAGLCMHAEGTVCPRVHSCTFRLAVCHHKQQAAHSTTHTHACGSARSEGRSSAGRGGANAVDARRSRTLTCATCRCLHCTCVWRSWPHRWWCTTSGFPPAQAAWRSIRQQSTVQPAT
jgi:hypothetical protein